MRSLVFEVSTSDPLTFFGAASLLGAVALTACYIPAPPRHSSINPPIALYYMQGLNTTPVHGHTALFGVYGMLGLGLILFCLRALRPGRAWKNAPRSRGRHSTVSCDITRYRRDDVSNIAESR